MSFFLFFLFFSLSPLSLFLFSFYSLFLSLSLGDAQLVQQGFSGCLRDVQVKMIDSPSEVWQPLDWSRATERVVAYESWEGCPAHTEEGAHFLGQGSNKDSLELKGLTF